METKKKKSSTLDINENYDFRFTTQLSPVVRWILVLPIGFLATFAVHIAYGFVANLLLKNFNDNETVNIIAYGILSAIKYCVFIIAMVATAPVAQNKKGMTAVCCGVIAAIVGIASTMLSYTMAETVDSTMLTVTSVTSLLGIAWAVWHIYNNTSKPKTVQEDKGRGMEEA